MKPKYIILSVILSLICLLISVTAAEATHSALPCDVNGDDILTEAEVFDAICDYMLEDSPYTLRDVKDSSYIFSFWDGKPKKVNDYQGREVAFYRPVNRLITTNPDNSRIVIALGDIDKLVSTDEATRSSCILPRDDKGEKVVKYAWENLQIYGGGQLDDLPETNKRHEIDYETMAMLQPDLVLDATWYDRADLVEEKLGVPCVVAGAGFIFEESFDHIRMLGEILDRQERAEELVEFIRSKIEMVESVTSQIDESKKPTVYFAPRGAQQGFFDAVEGRDFTRTEAFYEPLYIAGGINVARDVTGDNINVPPEQIIAWMPDVIFVAWSFSAVPGEPTGVDFVMETSELSRITAVQNNQVFACVYPFCRGRSIERSLLNMIYMAKRLHPEEFHDLDMEAEGNEVYKQFFGFDGVFTEITEIWPFMKEVY